MQQMDIAGEDLVYTASNWWYQSVYNWTAASNDNSQEIKFPYRTFYRIIRNSNAIINNADAASRASRGEKYNQGTSTFI